MTAHNLFDVKDCDKGLYSERRITVTRGDTPTPVDFKLQKPLAYYDSEAMRLKGEGEYF